LLTSLAKDLGQWLQPVPSFYGMHVAAVARTALDLELVAETVLQNGLKTRPSR
jgi:hypothetical protein